MFHHHESNKLTIKRVNFLFSIPVAIFLLMLVWPKTALAVDDPPQYVYIADQLSWYGQYNNISSPRKWWTSALNGNNQRVRYYVESGNSEETHIVNAINNWNSKLPSWARFQRVTNESQADLGFNVGPICPAGIAGCFVQQSWYTDGWSKNTTWTAAVIKINTDPQYSNDLRKAIPSHEIGHALGFHERYISNPSSYSLCYNGEAAATMDGTWRDTKGTSTLSDDTIHPCDGTTAPTNLDGQRVNKFYKQGTFKKSDGTYSECGSYSSQQDIWVTTSSFGQRHIYGRFVDCAWHSVGYNYNIQRYQGGSWVDVGNSMIATRLAGAHNKLETLYIDWGSSVYSYNAYYRICARAVVRTPFNSSTVTYSTAGWSCTDSKWVSPP